MPIFSSLGMKRSDTAASNAGATTESPKSTLSALTPAPRPHKHRRDLTPEPKRAPSPPSSPEDSPTRDLAAKRVGERSLTPYPPPMYAPRVSMGNRSVTPYPGLRRWSSRDVASGDADTQASIRSSSPDKNELFDRSSAQSPTPSLKKGIFDGEVRVRTLSNCSTDSRYTFGVPTNSPRSVSRSSSSSDISVLSKASQDPMTPPMIARALGARLFEIEVTRRCKELTKMSLADATDAYADRLEGVDIACPPNTPASREAHDNW